MERSLDNSISNFAQTPAKNGAHSSEQNIGSKISPPSREMPGLEMGL
jgi:hypothetical protein